MTDTTKIYSNRYKVWINAMPMPYPPTWVDKLSHWFSSHNWFGERDADCRVCLQLEYQEWEKHHRLEQI